MNVPILEEFNQINEYVRTILTVYVAWFSFFFVLLLSAMGWAIKEGIGQDGKLRTLTAFRWMYSLFALQLLLGIAATVHITFDVFSLRARGLELLQLLMPGTNTPYEPRPPAPSSLGTAFILMGFTLFSNLVFWSSIYYRLRKQIGSQL